MQGLVPESAAATSEPHSRAAEGYRRLSTGIGGFDVTRYSALPQVLAVHPPRRGFGAVVMEHDGPELEALGHPDPTHGIIVPLRPGTRFEAGPVPHRLRAVQAAPADAAVLPAGTANHWRSRSAFRNLHLCLDDTLLRRVCEEDGIARRIELRPTLATEAPGLHVVARELAAELATPGPLSNALVDAYALAVAVHLFRLQEVTPRGTVPGRLALAPWRLRRAEEFIEAHLADDLGLDEMAAAAGLSPFHFARCFRRATGVSPYRYLVQRRIERAKALLASTGLPIAEIALACGYAAQPAFTRAFSRTTGISPARFRARSAGT